MNSLDFVKKHRKWKGMMSFINAGIIFLVVLVILFVIGVVIIVTGFIRSGSGDLDRAVRDRVPRKPPVSERDPSSRMERPDAYSGSGLGRDVEHERLTSKHRKREPTNLG
jgi:hypothetical protein